MRRWMSRGRRWRCSRPCSPRSTTSRSARRRAASRRGRLPPATAGALLVGRRRRARACGDPGAARRPDRDAAGAASTGEPRAEARSGRPRAARAGGIAAGPRRAVGRRARAGGSARGPGARARRRAALQRAAAGGLRAADQGDPRAIGAAARPARSQGIATWFAALIRSWVDATPPADELPTSGTLAGYLARRVAEVGRVASGPRPGCLVALPSYAGGWIEPGELVARLAAARTSGRPEPDMPLDFPQALLRVLPIRREAALAAASELRGEVGDAVRHALGGSAVVGPTAALWAAAARCRAPDRGRRRGRRRPSRSRARRGARGQVHARRREGRGGAELRRWSGVPGAAPRDDLPTDLLWRTSAQPRAMGTRDRWSTGCASSGPRIAAHGSRCRPPCWS